MDIIPASVLPTRNPISPRARREEHFSHRLSQQKRLLLCTDFSPAARSAFEAAVRLAEPTGCKVTVLHVCEFGPLPATTDEGIAYIDDLYGQEDRKLQSVVHDLQELGIDTDSMNLDGNPASVILELMERIGFDLVVLGTRATSGFERLLCGSTAERIFRSASCPVLTVGTEVDLSNLTLRAPIVFATDFRGPQAGVASFAAAVANRLGASLHCVHVLPPSAQCEGDQAIESVMREALQSTFSPETLSVPPVFDIAYARDVAAAIVDYARSQKAQMIVLGIGRKTRLAAHLPGQRTYRIITSAPCPVLTLSAEE